MKSIFIISSERSGSNLVREMLNAHPNISAPPAAQLPRFLTAYRPYYDDLLVDENMRQMIADAIAINKTHPEQLDVHASVDEIFAKLSERSVWGLISTLYSLNAREQGKTVWVSKDNFLFDYVDAIRHTLPAARFIYLFRDGRDYAASMRQVGTSSMHIYYVAKQWQREQQASLLAYHSLRQKGNMYLLRYEDLIQDPESVLKQLCDFLGEPFDESMINFYSGDTARNLAVQSDFWKNLNKPVMKKNFAKFKKELSSREIWLFEAVAGRELTLLGYPLVSNVPVHDPSRFVRFWYGVQNGIAKYLRLQNLKRKELWRKHREAVLQGIHRRLFTRQVSVSLAKPLKYE